MSLLKIRLFGFPNLAIDDVPLKLDRRKTLAVLAYLAAGRPSLHPGAAGDPFTPSRDTLAALLWPDCGQDQAGGYLRQALWDFNKAGGEAWIRREGATLGLIENGGMWVDVRVFEERLNAWKSADTDDPAALDLLRDATLLYTADFLAGFSLRDSPDFDAWQTLRAEGLRLALAEALEALSHLLAARGEYEEALSCARRWLALDELNEPAQRELMRLLHESGKRSAALRQYQACQRILQEQLGVAPEPATTQLFEQINARKPARLTAQDSEAAPPLAAFTPHPAARAPVPVFLPAQTTPFLGREVELARIKELLSREDCRLVTLVGPGGSGKTRLAIQAAGQSIGYPHHLNFPHGIYFTGLASAATEAEAMRAIAAAVKLEFRVDFGLYIKIEEAREQLLEYLAGKKVLLVLDNLEQLVDCAGLFSDLLAAAPGLKLVATSRVRLNLAEEWVFEVGGLPYPEDTAISPAGDLAHFAAVQLFLKGAERASGFRPQAEDWPAIARIARLVEGLPLGIELASTWVKMLTCQEIADEMGRSLDFLETTRPGLPERHRSLRAVFEYSWKLLSGRERAIFQRLAIFRSGFTREAAYEIAGASLELLSSFSDKSLLRRVASGRFDLHQLVKQYAAEKLAADPACLAETEERHAHHTLGWLRRKSEGLKGADQVAALTALRWEKQNLRRAWNWLAAHHEYAAIEQALPDCILFFEMDGDNITAVELLTEVIRAVRLEAETNSPGALNGLLGLALAGVRNFERDRNNTEPGLALQRESLELALTLPHGLTRAYIFLLVSIGFGAIELEKLMQMCRESVATFESAGDLWGVALASLVQADVINFNHLGEDLAREVYEKSLQTFTRLGNDWGRALCFFGLSTITASAGQMEDACRLMQTTLEIYLRLGNMSRVIETRSILGEFYANLGQVERASQYFIANRDFLEEVGAHERSQGFRERLERLRRQGTIAQPGTS